MDLRQRTLALAAAVATAAGIGAALASARPAVRAVETPLSTGVVAIDTNLRYQGAAAAGTGMVIAQNGVVLTNNHVVRGATAIRVAIPGSGRSYPARVLGYAVGSDVAVLQLQGASGLSTVALGRSARVRVGDAVTALGNAGGTGSLLAGRGRITGLRRTITASDESGSSERLTGLFETNAPLQPGDSGGPLFDASRHVIGMDTAASAGFFFQQGSSSDAYAIPIDRALTVARQIVAGRASAAVHVGPTAFVGVSVQAAGPYQDGGAVAGALVSGVVPGSAADQAGLVPGDVVTSFAGHAVATPTALGALVLRQPAGASVQLGWVDQSGASHTATVTLASGPPQ